MKLVYVAGKFTGPNSWAIEQNVRAAEDVGMQIALLGAMPVIPHSNTRFFHGTFTDEFWYEGTMELLRRCDAVMLVPGWQKSRGAQTEAAEAKRLGIPVFESLTGLQVMLKAAFVGIDGIDLAARRIIGFICRCAGPDFDPDVPCPVPGHGKLSVK